MGCSTSSQTSTVDPARPGSKREESNGASTTGAANENGNVAEDSVTLPDQTPVVAEEATPSEAAPAPAPEETPPAPEEPQPPAASPPPETEAAPAADGPKEDPAGGTAETVTTTATPSEEPAPEPEPGGSGMENPKAKATEKAEATEPAATEPNTEVTPDPSE